MTAATFAFLVTVWFSDGTPPEVFVEDSGLTGEDCIALLLEHDGPGEASCVKE
ncbi:hypothetical protein [Celeribacter halophilus]|uniref:Uncharacterized protein n=1 Tax=Celeribacter halophilus TaxID=576117 RepID=A0A1I3XE23_9RHOB|nr:hypothetical protein [Celeribacter halophilus]PZX03042.1 hypothetical protein LX82_03801 [Celeribacter halophilus]SFK17800.1 hypothetical protein SAMN04488138_1502 [Celeribacter halophilus]